MTTMLTTMLPQGEYSCSIQNLFCDVDFLNPEFGQELTADLVIAFGKYTGKVIKYKLAIAETCEKRQAMQAKLVVRFSHYVKERKCNVILSNEGSILFFKEYNER